MEAEEIKNLKSGDRLRDPLHRRAEVVRRTPHGVVILWEDGEEKLYPIGDPILLNLSLLGPRQPGHRWLRKARP
ncbi:MAG: hypothetical protein QOI53_4648 [Verrucomicrobiota bacterium]|jgi:hypothetical protein|nr:hypothetical protein [Verrucomicrobiota bacterium]